jgi:hypothetical protein
MKNYDVSFILRFSKDIAGHTFLSEVECDDGAAATKACRELLSDEAIQLTAAQICIFTGTAGGCDQLDDDSTEIFESLCRHLSIGLETFWNRRMGWYDKYNNRVEPMNLGHHFPDATYRVVWEQDSALLLFDETLDVVKTAVELLVEMQEIPYFGPSEDEYESGATEPLVERRTDALFKVGCWPDAESQFDLDALDARATVLDDYRVPVAG